MKGSHLFFVHRQSYHPLVRDKDVYPLNTLKQACHKLIRYCIEYTKVITIFQLKITIFLNSQFYSSNNPFKLANGLFSFAVSALIDWYCSSVNTVHSFPFGMSTEFSSSGAKT